MLDEYKTLDKWQQVIKQITYKPESKLFIELRSYGLELCITAMQPVVDSKSGQPTNIRRMARLPINKAPRTTAKILACIKDLIVNLELHEVDEFLKYRGKFVKHPHPERRTND